MNNIIPISEVRSKLPSLVDQVSELSSQVLITVKGKVKAMLISYDDWVSTQETLELLSDQKAMKSIRQGIKEIESGHTIPWNEIKKELNL